MLHELNLQIEINLAKSYPGPVLSMGLLVHCLVSIQRVMIDDNRLEDFINLYTMPCQFRAMVHNNVI